MTGIPNFFIFVLSNQHVKENAQVAYSNYCNIIRQRKVRYHKTTLILTSRRSDSTCEGREHFTESSLLLVRNKSWCHFLLKDNPKRSVVPSELKELQEQWRYKHYTDIKMALNKKLFKIVYFQFSTSLIQKLNYIINHSELST